MFFFGGLLNEKGITRRVRGDFLVDGGSGRSQVGGMPALTGVKGRVRLMVLDSLMVIN